jgi:RNA polymerase sigma-70 factor (ECF subfamily)
MPLAHELDRSPTGTDATLAAIYREHFPFVWRSLKALGFDDGQAEDLAQDVFLVVRRRLPDFQPGRAIKPWLFGITRRVASQQRRTHVRAERRLRLLAPSDDDPSPEQSMASMQAAALVDRFLDELDDDRRALFVLSEIEGLSGTEIAEALDINRNTIYTRLRALRQRFEQLLERWMGEARSES